MPYVDNDGVAIYYESHGSGVPVVLLHGGGETSAIWHDLGWVNALSEHYKVIVTDARGHGKSDRPSDHEAYAVETRARDVVSVLNELNIERAHLTGYSMGGDMCFSVLALAPERVISIAPGGANPYPKDLSIAREWVAERYKDWEAAGNPKLAVDPPGFLAILDHNETGTGIDPREIDVPTLIYTGTLDPHYDQIKRAAGQISGAQLIEYEGEDHSVFRTRNPEIRTAVASFLDEVSGAHS